MKEMTHGYRELEAWQLSMALVPEIYEIRKKLPPEERYALGEQMRGMAISIPTNIAEGQGSGMPGEFAWFLSKARGSLSALDTLLVMAQQLSCLKKEDVKGLVPMMKKTDQLIHELLTEAKSKTP